MKFETPKNLQHHLTILPCFLTSPRFCLLQQLFQNLLTFKHSTSLSLMLSATFSLLAYNLTFPRKVNICLNNSLNSLIPPMKTWLHSHHSFLPPSLHNSGIWCPPCLRLSTPFKWIQTPFFLPDFYQ